MLFWLIREEHTHTHLMGPKERQVHAFILGLLFQYLESGIWMGPLVLVGVCLGLVLRGPDLQKQRSWRHLLMRHLFGTACDGKIGTSTRVRCSTYPSLKLKKSNPLSSRPKPPHKERIIIVQPSISQLRFAVSFYGVLIAPLRCAWTFAWSGLSCFISWLVNLPPPPPKIKV